MISHHRKSKEIKLEEQERLQSVDGLKLTDNDLHRLVFYYQYANKVTEAMVSFLTGLTDVKIKETIPQYYISLLEARREYRLDVYAEDTKNRRYVFEFQRDPARASAERAATLLAAICSKMIWQEEDLHAVPDIYLFFITQACEPRFLKPLYHHDIPGDDDRPISANFHFTSLNAIYTDPVGQGTTTGVLAHDLRCTNPLGHVHPRASQGCRLLQGHIV